MNENPTPPGPFSTPQVPLKADATPVVSVETADEIRHKLVQNFEAAKPVLDGYYAYAQKAAALAQEYHAARFKECFLTAKQEEMTLACTFDARETPVTLDRKLSELGSLPVKLVIFDRVKSTYYIYV